MAGWLNMQHGGGMQISRPTHDNTGISEDRWVTSSTHLRFTDINMIVAAFRDCQAYFAIPDVEGDDTILRQAVLAAALSRGSLRNRLQNGTFNIAQRGTSFNMTAIGTYLDRWHCAWNGSGGVRALTRETHAMGDEPYSRDPYYMRWDQTTAGTGATNNHFMQKIEGVGTFADEPIVLSFLARAQSAINFVSIRWVQYFGTGGTPSATSIVTFIGSANLAIGTAWKQYKLIGKPPSIAGKTLGTNGNDYAGLQFLLPINSVFRFDIDDVQVEPGFVGTEFDRRHPEVEMQMCRRHFERIGGTIAATHFGRGFADSTTHAFTNLPYTEKRATPTVTVTGGTTEFEVQRQGSAVIDTTAVVATASQAGRKSCQLDATVAAGLTAGEGVGLRGQSTTAVVDVSAELP